MHTKHSFEIRNIGAASKKAGAHSVITAAKESWLPIDGEYLTTKRISSMDKIVISSEEVASVETSVPPPLAQAKLPPPIPWPLRILLCPLVLVLPLLCLVVVAVRLATRNSVPRVRQAWLGFLCSLLAVSGLLTSFGVATFAVLGTAAMEPAAPEGWKVTLPNESTAATSTLSPADLAKRVGNSVFIVTRDIWRSPSGPRILPNSGFGTGVLLFAGPSEYIVATCRHVVDGEDWQTARPYAGDVLLLDREGGAARAKVIGRHKDLDLMILSVPRPPGGGSFAQPIRDFAQVPAGEQIVLFGHPEGLFFSLSDGLVSRKDTEENLLQITAPVSPGASGGPVYDLHGQLVGIVTAMVDKETKPNSENLNFAVRADALLQRENWDATPQGRAALESLASALAAASVPAPQASPASSPEPSPEPAIAAPSPSPLSTPASTPTTKPNTKRK